MSPPPADNSITAAVVFGTQEPKESESMPIEAVGLPNISQDDCNEENGQANTNLVSSISQSDSKVCSGLSLAPMDVLVKTVNAHLKDCSFCKGSCLELQMGR